MGASTTKGLPSDLFYRFRDRLEQGLGLGAGPEKQTRHILSMIS
ncbi:MAG: hypothetical protein ABR534_09780 [Desulfotignum sp.]